MPKAFFIFIFVLFGVIFAQKIAVAEDKIPQSLEEINAELINKKKQLDPFNEKSIKIDVESLGLDDVEKKNQSKSVYDLPKDDEDQVTSEISKTNKKSAVGNIKKSDQKKSSSSDTTAKSVLISKDLSEKPSKQNKNSEESNSPSFGFDSPISKDVSKDMPKDTKAEIPKTTNVSSEASEASTKVSVEESLKNKDPKNFLKEVDSMAQKAKNFLQKTISKKYKSNADLKDQKLIESDLKKDVDTKNSPKNKNPKKGLKSNKKVPVVDKVIKEKIHKETEKERQEKLKKLNELRQIYLDQASKDQFDKDENLQDEDFESDKKIVPQKKELNPFIIDELPAMPILERYRTQDNAHIPTIMTPKERIDLMFSAISMSDVSVFNESYKYILNPNVANNFGDTILTYAILLKKYPVIASILSKGADPDMPNKLGYSPITIAIEMLDFKALELLAANKADLKYIDGLGRTYLMHAARVGFLPAVDFFVKNGVDVNAMDNDGFTALAIAYRHKKEIIVQYLIKNGAKTWIEKPYDLEKQSLMKDLENRWQ